VTEALPHLAQRKGPDALGIRAFYVWRT